MLMKFTIPLRPVTKKNHQQIRRNHKTGNPYIAQSDAYQEYERQCELLIPAEYKQQIDRPVIVKAVYYMPQARRVDITNLDSALHDVLVKAGVLKDDSSLSPRIVVGTVSYTHLRKYEETHSRDEFMELIGRSYL